MHKVFTLPDIGLELEVGKFARQADGSAWMKVGGTVVLSTVVASRGKKDFMGFLPLTVEYRERPSAAGKIPGGYLKREGRLSDHEILISRLIDRPIRPLFSTHFFDELQIISTVYSSDGGFPEPILGLLGASIALTISDIPFLGPIGAVQITRVDNEWKFNVGHEDSKKADAEIIVAGTLHGICMVEGFCNDLPEDELIDLLFQAHVHIKKQVEWQLQVAKELGVKKIETPTKIDWSRWETDVASYVTSDRVKTLFAATKNERSVAGEKLKGDFMLQCASAIEGGEISETVLSFLFEQQIKKHFANIVSHDKKRIDGRALDQVRPISCEVGILPFTHGSAIFTRGETQALSSVTLGTAQDAQKVDSLTGGVVQRSFMLHYNFLPFSTGEVRPMRGPGRREIGHGFLAESSFTNVLPTQADFPYTVRSAVDVLESNGSSSMATVCATTLALMDTGVPIDAMVSGIAMGMVKDDSGNCQILTDILGTEDAYGLMDFKVTGTRKGIMAFQLDIKDKVGLPKELMQNALSQAKVARLHILDEMCKVLDKPRDDISELAPRVYSLKVPQDMIGAIIGPGGKIIKEIVAQTETQIDIEDDGKVNIFAKTSESAQKAVNWIRTIVGEIEVGAVYDGIIKKIADFGIFVELVPGKEGLVHVSTIDRQKQRDLNQLYKTGDRLNVTVMAYEKETGRIRLMSQDLKNPPKD